jgi:tetratricopeptide (TPR) repeat protein
MRANHQQRSWRKWSLRGQKRILKRSAEIAAAVGSAVWQLLTTLVSKPMVVVTCGVVAVVVLVEWRTSPAIIEDFEISPALVKDGVTARTVAYTLDAKLKLIQNVAGSSMPMQAFSIDRAPQYTIPGTGITLSFLIDQAKQFFSGHQMRVGGAITTVDNKLQTVVRVRATGEENISEVRYIDKKTMDGCWVNRFAPPSTQMLAELDLQIACAAEQVLRITHPYILAVYYKEIGETAAARELLQFILFHPPQTDNHWAYNLLGSMARDEARKSGLDERTRSALRQQALNYLDEADRTFASASKDRKDLKFPQTHVNRAILLADDPDKFSEARKQYEKAIDHDASYGIAYSNLAGLLARRANRTADEKEKERLWQEAVSYYERGVKRAHNRYQIATIYTNWADSLSDRAQFAEAQEKISSATASDQTYADAHYTKGRILRRSRSGSQQDVLDAFSKAAELRPWNNTYAFEHAKSLRDAQLFARSIEEFQKITKRDPANVTYRFEYAKTLTRTVDDRHEQFLVAVKAFHEAYDMRANNNPQAAPRQDDIGNELRLFVGTYLRTIAKQTPAARQPSDVLMFVGDLLLNGRHLVLADQFYRDAVTGSLTAGEKEALVSRIVKKLMDAADAAATAGARSDIIELARRYRPDDEAVLIQRFMTLIEDDKFEEALSFAQSVCGRGKNFDQIVRRWSPAWKCGA